MQHIMTIGEIMNDREVVTLEKDTTVKELAKTLADHNISCVIIAEHKLPIGIISERDIVRKVVAKEKNANKLTCKEIMTSPIFTVPSSMKITAALKVLHERRIRRLVVEDNHEVKGVITQSDIVKATANIQEYNTNLTFHQNLQSYVIIVTLIFVVVVILYRMLMNG